MGILDVLYSPWAILPEHLAQMQEIYAARIRGERLEAGRSAPLAGPVPGGYEIQNGVAIIPVRGAIAQRMSLMQDVSGGTSSDLLARDIRAAADDKKAKAILLHIDSPGGTVAGTEAAASVLFQARQAKPTAALSDGVIASAAYWIASAASQIYVGSQVDRLGSIGVVATHRNIAEMEKAAGIQTTEITAGKYKRIASQYGPLTESGRKSIQDEVDAIYKIFVDTVADYRSITIDKALAMADGKVFIGQQAIDIGLADGFSSLDTLMSQLNDQTAGWEPSPARRPSAALPPLPMAATGPPAPAAQLTTLSPLSSMTTTPEQVAQWATENPAAATILRDEGAAAERAKLQPQIEQARAAGADAERERVAGVRAALVPGHEALIERFCADGKTTGGDAALAVIAAERELLEAAAATRLAQAVPVAPFAGVEETRLEAAAPRELTQEESAALGQKLGFRAREIIDAAKAQGRTLTPTQAMAQARAEFSTSA
ncbi:MAG: S49 family peptidase [Cyanobacteriota bacterium]|jgi:signal peptide peptidase SppA